MPVERIDLATGQITNVHPHGLRRGASFVCNYMLDEHGNNVSRPGLSSFATLTGSLVPVNGDPRIIGLYPYREWVVAVNNNRRVLAVEEDGSYTDITGSETLGGDIAPTFVEDDDGALLIFGGPGVILRWDGSGLCERFGGRDGMPRASHAVILARYLICNNVNSDRIDYSRPEDHSVFDVNDTGSATEAAGFFTAENSADAIVAIMEQWGLLYLFGERTTEMYYATGDADSPFSWQWAVPVGLVGARAIAKADNTIFWVGPDRVVYRLAKDGQPQTVSWEVEATLRSLPRVDNCIAHHIEIDGRHLIAFVFPSSGTTLVHDYTLSGQQGQVWYEWRQWDSSTSAWTPFSLLAYCYHPEWQKHLCSSVEDGSGAVFELSTSVYTDNGENIRRIRRLAPIDRGSSERLKWSHVYRFQMLRGSTTIMGSVDTDDSPPSVADTPDGANPKLLVRTRELGKPWGNPREVSLGRSGDTNAITGVLRRNGEYRVREIEIEDSNPCRTVLCSMEEEYDVQQEG
jgi:hypothetical protein